MAYKSELGGLGFFVGSSPTTPGGVCSSITDSTGSSPTTITLVRGVKVFPNDPVVTGVPNGPFAAPVKYDRR